LNVAGRERFFRPTSLNQLSKHHRRFSETNAVSSEHLHSLLIANYNYGSGYDPRKRGDMFGTGTTEARERLLAEEHGAISTFDLYRLVRAMQRHEVHLGSDDLLKLLLTEGIVDFEEFLKSLEQPVTDDIKPTN